MATTIVHHLYTFQSKSSLCKTESIGTVPHRHSMIEPEEEGGKKQAAGICDEI